MTLRLEIYGDHSDGWVWSVCLDGIPLVVTNRLALEDLDLALFGIQRDKDRLNPHFDSASDAELFCLFAGFFRGGLYDSLRDVAEQQVWAKHFVVPRVGLEVLNYMFLFGGEKSRLLVGSPLGGVVVCD